MPSKDQAQSNLTAAHSCRAYHIIHPTFPVLPFCPPTLSHAVRTIRLPPSLSQRVVKYPVRPAHPIPCALFCPSRPPAHQRILSFSAPFAQTLSARFSSLYFPHCHSISLLTLLLLPSHYLTPYHIHYFPRSCISLSPSAQPTRNDFLNISFRHLLLRVHHAPEAFQCHLRHRATPPPLYSTSRRRTGQSCQTVGRRRPPAQIPSHRPDEERKQGCRG